MFYLLLICVFVEFDQTIHLRPVHFTMCKLHLHFLKKKERKKLQWERFIELPNITKLEIKLKESLFATSIQTHKRREPVKEGTSLCFLECRPK